MSIFDLFKKIEQPAGKIEFIIVGLGNPGKNYEKSRHNAGFLCIDYIAQYFSASVTRAKWQAFVGEAVIGGKRALLMKPQTFMNNSGIAVREAADFYKIPPENVFVIFDDISLAAGKQRIRRKGSDGGHNGIKSIIYNLESDEFPRYKIGVGERKDKEADLARHVLGNFSKEEEKAVFESFKKCGEILPLILSGLIDAAMNEVNG